MLFSQTMLELYLPNLMSDIIDIGVVNEDMDYIINKGFFMLGVALLSAFLVITSSYMSSFVASRFAADLRKKVFERVTSYSAKEINKFGVSSLITRTTNDINQIQQVTVMIFRMMISAPIMMIGGVIMALSKDVKLSLVIIAVLPVLALLIVFVAKKGIPLFKENQIRLDKLTGVVREYLIGIRIVRAFNKSNHEKDKFDIANEALTSNAIKVNRIMALMMPAMMFIMNITVVGIVWFGGIRIDQGSMQVGDMMAFMQYAMQIMFSLLMFSMMFVMIPRAQASAVRIVEVLETENTIIDPSNPKKLEIIDSLIEFDNVSFSYEGATENALENINFKVKKGEILAIIGGTGSGKTTILNLINRFYDVSNGRILLDGLNIKDITMRDLRERIGLVTQKAEIFSGSIEENIIFGNDSISQNEILEITKISQMEEFLTNMDNGYKSHVSQGGTTISGGQKQRLSIARAIAKKPDIYLFDDSFSALDYKTDRLLRTALKERFKNSAVIVVAQRISSIKDADKILVIDDGKICGYGTHNELMESSIVYQEIVYSQLSKEEIA
jgi:ATP-binding cassette subfamily B protein